MFKFCGGFWLNYSNLYEIWLEINYLQKGQTYLFVLSSNRLQPLGGSNPWRKWQFPTVSLWRLHVHYFFIHSKADKCFHCRCVLSMQIPLKILLRDLRSLQRPRCDTLTPPTACRRLKLLHGRCSASRRWWSPHSHIQAASPLIARGFNASERTGLKLSQSLKVRRWGSCLQFIGICASGSWIILTCITKELCRWATWWIQVGGWKRCA